MGPPVRAEMEKSEVELDLLLIEDLSKSKFRLAANISQANSTPRANFPTCDWVLSNSWILVSVNGMNSQFTACKNGRNGYI